ncbi:MAG: cyclic nucleotide-binding domain-containing protein [Gammaproteobacteria bacterium]|nr:cyclic nucleotide-binding domain-containing protein [Gammaproteobacteria bacterium]
MSAEKFREFSPLNTLSKDNFHRLAETILIKRLPAEKVLFKEGEHDNWVMYVLDGEVEVQDKNGVKAVIGGGSDDAKHPVVDVQPRRATAKSKTDITIALIDRKEMDIVLTWDQSADKGIKVGSNEDEGEDWTDTILRAKIFYRIPPANIQAVFMRMEPVPFNKDDVVITEGEDGDYFYIVREGKCKVTRNGNNGDSELLADMEAGDCFGEDALISDAKRNATVTMVTDGILMRLGKEDFNNLLNEPVLNKATMDEAKQMIKDGAEWLDVRLPAEHQENSLEGSMNIPLASLRNDMMNLDKGTRYIVYCDTGRRSSAAVYTLTENDFDAYVLEGGLSAWS